MTARDVFFGCRGVSSLITCAAIGASALGCGVGAGGDVTPPHMSTCGAPVAGGAWWNEAFAEQTAMFHAEFDATPSTSSLNVVVGLGEGGTSDVGQLAAAVRFNFAGTIDVRSGDGFQADQALPYQLGKRHHIRLDLDVRAHIYAAWLRNDAGSYELIARNASFHTAQQAVTRLDNVAGRVDSPTGMLEVCGFATVADATTADGCLVAVAGDGPVNVASVLDTATFRVTPSARDLEAVIGLSAGPADDTGDLAAALRFAPSGNVDALDGDAYRADVAMPYDLSARDFHLVSDLASHTYSISQGSPGQTIELARGYRFGAQHGQGAHLDRLSAIVEGAQGRVKVCAVRAAP